MTAERSFTFPATSFPTCKIWITEPSHLLHKVTLEFTEKNKKKGRFLHPTWASDCTACHFNYSFSTEQSNLYRNMLAFVLFLEGEAINIYWEPITERVCRRIQKCVKTLSTTLGNGNTYPSTNYKASLKLWAKCAQRQNNGPQ